MGGAPAGWGAEDPLGVDPDPDIQGLFWAELGFPACQAWAWGLEEGVEEDGVFVLKEGPEKLLLDEPAKKIKK